MKKSYIEIGDSDICLCGSDKRYKNCCKKKKIKFLKCDDEIIKQIPMGSEVKEILKVIQNLFIEYYGRKPRDDERVFSSVPIYRNTDLVDFINIAREVGVKESKIYAYYKTGLIPWEGNIDLIPNIDLCEYQRYCEEFEELMSEDGFNCGKINSVQYVVFVDSYLLEKIKYFSTSFTYVLNDFISRHQTEYISEYYNINSELDFLIFSALRNALTIEGAMKLKNDYMPETIYSLSRSIFENYLYLFNINNNENFFEDNMFPKIDRENFEFGKYNNGKTNYNKVINKKTGEVKTLKDSVYDLSKSLILYEDKQIYDIFYRAASRYIHIDILSAKNFFSVYDLYNEINPTYISLLILFSLVILVLEESAKNKKVQGLFKKDMKHFLSKISHELDVCFNLVMQDKQNHNEIYNIFQERVRAVLK